MSLRAQSLKDIFTFTRASTATYFNAAGTLTTAAVDEPRIDYDPATLACRGLLLEEQRTNLILNSATFATQNVTVTNVAHTLSFYGTGTIALTGVASPEVSLVGTGAYTRVSLTFTPASASPSTLTLTATGTVTMAQLEAGSYATSYISTTTETGTRARDVCYTTALTPWFSESEGTLMVEYMVPSLDGGKGQFLAEVDGGTVANGQFVYISGGSEKGDITSVVSSPVVQASITGGTASAGVSHRIALAWASDDVAIHATGGSLATDTSATMPSSQTHFRLGAYLDAGYELNGYIRKVKFYPRRLSNTELAALVA
jgi:hypothetical protein